MEELAAGDQVAVRQDRERAHRAVAAGAEAAPGRTVVAGDVLDQGRVTDQERAAGHDVAVWQRHHREHFAIEAAARGARPPLQAALGAGGDGDYEERERRGNRGP